MSGNSSQIQGNNLVEVLEQFIKFNISAEQMGLSLDSATLIFKDKKGKYIGIGNNGIETSVNKIYGEKITKNIALLFHHSC